MLNDRQKRLYDYLLFRSERGLWTNREQILIDLEEWYGAISNTNLYYDANAQQLTKDIRIINNSEVEKVIISNSHKGIKVATKEELKAALEKEKISCLKRLKRYWNKVTKYELNNQCTLEETIIQSFVKEINNV